MNNHFNKRGRNHQRRRQGVNPNRALDSNGPDVRIRGTAQQIYDKYLALARDATSSGDRVKAENYLQHAEHYFRVLRAVQGPQAPSFEQSGGDGDFDGDQPSIGGDRDQRQPQQEAPESEEAEGDGGDQPAAEAQPNGGDVRPHEPRPEGDFEARRRRRRPRRGPREETGPAESGENAAPEPAGAE